MTVALEKPENADTAEQAEKTAPVVGVRKVSRRMMVAAILVVWLLLFAVLRGKQTLTLAAADLTGLHRWFNDVNDSIGADRNSNPLFLYFFNEIRLVIDNLVTFIQHLISQPPPAVLCRRSAGSASSASSATSPGPWATGGSPSWPWPGSPSSGSRACGRRAWTRWR